MVTVDEGRVIALAPDRDHPLGGLTCAKGRAAPEIHDHPHRVNHPLRRTQPKTASDPGWERCSWDEALDLVATTMRRIGHESGPHAVVFGRGTAGGTGLGPAEPWVRRLAGAFGSSNYMTNTNLCNWARDGTVHYTFGVSALPPPDAERSNCVIVWGANPSATVISLAASISAAHQRGAKLIVIDPRRVGLASKADHVLQVRPGTDGALALAFVHLLIENRWYDDSFVRDWTNAPFLIRDDTGRLLRSHEVQTGTRNRGSDNTGARARAESGYVALEARTDGLVEYLPRVGRYPIPTGGLALRGSSKVDLAAGGWVRCRPVFELLAEEASRCTPERAAPITGVPEHQIREALGLIVEHRPVSHHVWNGIVQHTNATQTGRAIEIFYALLGDWDRSGGNVVQPRPSTADIGGAAPLSHEQEELRLGRDDRPLGPPVVPGNIAAFDLFTAILESRPYPVRAVLSFGSNTLLNTGDSLRGRQALQQLEFFAQAELFHTPTNQFADVLLPAATFLESEVLMITRSGRAERRRRTVDPLYERRSDVDIVFDLARRLGLSEWFAGGDVHAAYDEVLAPAGLSWDMMRDHPDGVRVTPDVRHEKHAATDDDGRPAGFGTPSGKTELFVDEFAAHGQSPLPVYEEPVESPVRTPELARDYPLVLTNAKRPRYLHSQHRGVSSLRRRGPDPTVEIHPDTASRFNITDGAWVVIETPRARVRAKADLTTAIVPGVVCANHGWWEACDELGLGALDPFDERGANVNLLVDNDTRDPISGAVPHRSALCRVRPVPDDDRGQSLS